MLPSDRLQNILSSKFVFVVPWGEDNLVYENKYKFGLYFIQCRYRFDLTTVLNKYLPN